MVKVSEDARPLRIGECRPQELRGRALTGLPRPSRLPPTQGYLLPQFRCFSRARPTGSHWPSDSENPFSANAPMWCPPSDWGPEAEVPSAQLSLRWKLALGGHRKPEVWSPLIQHSVIKVGKNSTCLRRPGRTGEKSQWGLPPRPACPPGTDPGAGRRPLSRCGGPHVAYCTP